MIAELLRAIADDFLDAPNAIPAVADRRRALAPLAAVAQAAAPELGVVDDPPSTWPHSMQRFYSRAAIALTELEILGAGDDAAPLSELWELYQAWMAESILSQLESVLGPARTPKRPAGILGSWDCGAKLVELHYMPTIPARPGSAYSICRAPLYASIGDLEPDLVLAARVGETTRLLVIDPKKRPFLDRGAVSVEASKYLWGIKGADHVVGVVLVAPLGGMSSMRAEGNAWTVMARPSGDVLPTAAITNWLAAVTL